MEEWELQTDKTIIFDITLHDQEGDLVYHDVTNWKFKNGVIYFMDAGGKKHWACNNWHLREVKK